MDTRNPQTDDEEALGSAALPTLMAVMFVNMVGFGIVVPLLPFYAKSFNAPAWEMALVFSAYAAGGFFGEPFWGRLSDRVGRKPILISTVCGNCLCYMALAFAPNIATALIVRFLGGLASGNGSVVQGYLADVTPHEHRSGRMSMLSASFNLGFIIGPALGGLLAHPSAGTAGFRIPLIVASSLAGVCALGITLFLNESRKRHHHSSLEELPSRWEAVGEALSHPVIVRLMLVTFLAGAAFMGIEFVFSLWSLARFNWGAKEVGMAFAVTSVVATVCQLTVTGWASRRWGEAPVLAFGMGLTAIAIVLQPFAISGWMVVTMLAISAFGQSVAWPNVSALISNNTDPDHQGQYLGLNNAAGAAARLAGPFVTGLAFTNLGIDWPFYLAGVAVLPAIWLALQAGRGERSA